MDIRYEQPLCGGVLQGFRFESGIDTAPGTLVKITAGVLAAVAANDRYPLGFVTETKDVSETADDNVQVIPFMPGHVYSVPAITDAAVGDYLAISGADAIDEDAANSFAMVWPNGGDTTRTYFVVTTSGILTGFETRIALNDAKT